jgi:hypothetical protein
MVEVRLRPGSRPEGARVTDRLKPSGGAGVVNVSTQQGHGPRRVISSHHHAGGQGHHTDHGSQSISDMPIVATGGRILGQRGNNNE